MDHRNLIKLLRKQHLPKLILPLVMILVSVVFYILNPFRNTGSISSINNLSELNSQYEAGVKYGKFNISKLYYSGYDYSIGRKTKAHIYYAMENGICYYIILNSTGSNGLATILNNYSFTARLTNDNKIYDELNRKLAENVNFTAAGMKTITCNIIINQYNYTNDFNRFLYISLIIIIVISAIFLILEILAYINPNLSSTVIRLKKYGNKNTLFTLAITELDTAVATGRKNVYITNSFLIVISRSDVDIVPLENISWIYDYNEMHHKKGHIRLSHPICIVTDAKKMIKIRHVAEDSVGVIIDAIVSKQPQIMVGGKNKD